ncbi:MAG: 3-dehydroquinate synthase [Clostridia bacterium]|nr:3-dehydroquinate synthase [Clostridia bacterium]
MILKVNLGERSYDIVIERGALKNAASLLDLDRRVLIVTDTGVPAEYSAAVSSASKRAYAFVMEQGEASKNFDNLTGILSLMTDGGFGRGDCVVAVGGGVCGDIAGFASAIYMRGVDFYNIPTTVLSQVDSSVGGKTAIDFRGIKNSVGAFKQPKKVVIDPDTLKTLPKRQINNGLCEALKMAATSDRELFELFETSDVYENIDIITEKSLKVKINVVEQDEKETGLRRVLNFGHTLGHGIESVCSPALYHGECVALGMLAMCSDEVRQRLIKIYGRLGVPQKADFDKDAVMYAVKRDKKKTMDSVNAVIVDTPGEFRFSYTSFDELEERLGAL